MTNLHSDRHHNRRTFCFGIGLAVCCLAVGHLTLNQSTANELQESRSSKSPSTQQRLQAESQQFQAHVVPLLKQFCLDCHNSDSQEGGITLQENETVETVRDNRKAWNRVLKILRVGAMPPKEYEERPTDTQREEAVSAIESILTFVDCDSEPDPGRITARRLNRSEYNNTIRDLIGRDFKPAKDFPSDDVGYGFDNIGDVLTLSPLLFEKYMSAAEKVANESIVVTDSDSPEKQVIAPLQAKGGAVSWNGFRSLTSTGSVTGKFQLSYLGRYTLRVEAAADQAGPDLAKMELRVNGKRIGLHQIKDHFESAVYESKFEVESDGPIQNGKCRIEARFVNDYYNPKAADKKDRDRNLFVGQLELVSPTDQSRIAYPKSHTRIVVARPGKNKTARQAAREVLSPFLMRAFRRPQPSSEVQRYVELAMDAMARGESYDRAIQLCVQAALVSPNFLFRLENDPQPHNPRHRHQVDQFELASRLSYFLWSSMPDNELFALATEGVLSKPDVLRLQVERMLADDKSQALVDNFASQWLNLRLLDSATPSKRVFPEFNGSLRKSMRRETELFFKAILDENRSIFEFLNADFTFVNEQLAKHYGIDGIKGKKFQRVSLKETQRSGVLTQASILTLTSDSGRTLPVNRGKWVLENIWGTPPPEPPADVPALDEVQKSHPKETLRQQLARHRSDPICASCHVVMDPIGLGFENFDAIGRWRDKEKKLPIDASGELPGSGRFSSPVELLRLIAQREDDFSRHLARTMLTYALGRGLEYYDKCAVDKILIGLKSDNYRFQTLIHEIVLSEPFLKRRGDGATQ